jgi:predicted nucleic acid-binding protein
MVVIDSSVWIDFFNARPNPQVELLAELLYDGSTTIIVPDVVLTEVLRGFRLEREFNYAQKLMQNFDIVNTGGQDAALQASTHYRALRSMGLTVCKFVDVWVASFCIKQDLPLLHNDRDFDAFEAHRGLHVLRSIALH